MKLPLKTGEAVAVIAARVREAVTRAWRRPGPERWLLIERVSDGAVKYYVSDAGRRAAVRQTVRWAHRRWTIEQGYQQLQEELGLDHFGGRSWRGLHHHLTLCLMASCFLRRVREGKKKWVGVAAGEVVAERGAGADAVSGVSQLSPCTQGGVVRLNLSYLT